MNTAETATQTPQFHPDAYRFVDQALRFTQKRLGRLPESNVELDEASAHISGPELLDGIRELALNEFGLMATTVLNYWGVRTTDDFGRIVFDFIERGFMRKTEHDQISDFFAVYRFEDVFDRDYRIKLTNAFDS